VVKEAMKITQPKKAISGSRGHEIDNLFAKPSGVKAQRKMTANPTINLPAVKAQKSARS